MSQEAELKENEVEKYSIGQFRQYAGNMTKVISVIAIVWAVFQLYVNSFGVMENIKHRVWFFGFMAVLIFLLVPARKREKKQRKLPSIWDIVCVIGAIASVGYFLTMYDAYVVDRGGLHIQPDYWFGTLGIAVAFEASRRAAGLPMTILAAVFFLYNYFGQYMPGPFKHLGFDHDRIIDAMWWGSDGVFGTVADVAATYIFLFILFGSFLRRSGFTEFISNLALAIAGRTSGGPAKVAVIGSSMMGMINGSGIANAATVGSFTIPMMKRTGYKPHFAAAVEAVAGTGGVLAPPVMGAASFVMASFLGIEYRVIILAALIPAILYFLMCFMSVHFEAKKLGLKGLPKEEIPRIKDTMKESGHLLIPVAILVVMIVLGMTPLFAAIFSILATVVVSWFKKETRMGLKVIGEALEEGARNVLIVSAACMIVGIVVGTISLTSLGLVIGNNILSLSGNSILLATIFTMLLTILLGTGVPVTASYIIAATISAPILAEMGIPLLLSHMFVFYYAALSEITPPVALSAMVTSGIAGANFAKVSLTAVRLGIVGFILPFFFIYNPNLLFVDGSITDSIIAGITGAIGIIALAASLSNWFFTKTNIVQRLLLAIAGLSMIATNFTINIAAVVVILLMLFWQMKSNKVELNGVY